MKAEVETNVLRRSTTFIWDLFGANRLLANVPVTKTEPNAQDVSRRSGLEPGGRARRKTPTVDCVGDSRKPKPARSPPFAGPLAAVGGVVTVRGRLPVTVPRPGDGPGPLARGCYGPPPRQRWLHCWRLGGDRPSSPLGLVLGREGGVGVGPLIHTPFLLEYSFWGILG